MVITIIVVIITMMMMMIGNHGKVHLELATGRGFLFVGGLIRLGRQLCSWLRHQSTRVRHSSGRVKQWSPIRPTTAKLFTMRTIKWARTGTRLQGSRIRIKTSPLHFINSLTGSLWPISSNHDNNNNRIKDNSYNPFNIVITVTIIILKNEYLVELSQVY